MPRNTKGYSIQALFTKSYKQILLNKRQITIYKLTSKGNTLFFPG